MKLLTLAVVLGLASCAGPSATGSYTTSASYDRLYAASLSAVPQVGFTVTNSNKADGVIVAQQGVVLGHGSSVGLNAVITNEPGQRRLQVNFKAPPATLALGNFETNVAEYVAAVKSRVPDLTAAP